MNSLVFVLMGVAAAGGDDDSLLLSNGAVARQFEIRDGRFRTVAIGGSRSAQSDRRWPVRDDREFEITLAGGTTLTARDYRVTRRKTQPKQGPFSELTVELVPRDSSMPNVTLHYEARAGDSVMRKTVTWQGTRRVERIAVEALELDASPDRGGFGQPLLIDNQWFVGLEYPGSLCEVRGSVLRCEHFPNRAEGTSRAAVIGMRAPSLSVEDSFLRYLASVRTGPRAVTVYNTWYDLRAPELTCAACQERFRELQAHLPRSSGAAIDTFVVDDGYQSPESLWQPNENWPKGFQPLVRELKEENVSLGLWLSFNGLGLDPRYGKQQGWTVVPARKPFYWLGDADYRDKLTRVIKRHLKESNVRFLKHDFNVFDVAPSGAPAQPADREVVMDATIELLAKEREAAPDLFLAITSGIWPSPWWLLYADAVWMGHADLSYDWSFPQRHRRAAEMTYRDEKLHRRLRVERILFPPSSLMTHGIIRGRHDGAPPGESFSEWSDYVVWTLGRGTQLRELYLSPSEMKGDDWSVLQSALAWARGHEQTLAHTVMIGGHPGRSEVHGYAHWSESMGIVALRNPSLAPARFVFDFSSRPGDMPNPSAWHPVVVYPQQELLPAVPSSGTSVLTLPSESVTIVHFYAEPPSLLAQVSLGPFYLERGTGDVAAKLISFLPTRHGTPHGVSSVENTSLWSSEIAFDSPSSAETVQLTIGCQPARGALLSGHPQIESARTFQPPPPSTHEWSIHEASVPARCRVTAELPPTPLWPVSANVTAVVHVTRPRLVADEQTLETGTQIPAWPMVLNAYDEGTDHVLVEGAQLHRGRGVPERVGWIFVLVALPCGLAWFLPRIVFPQSIPARVVLRFMAGIGLSVLYVLSPVGEWVLRTLQS